MSRNNMFQRWRHTRGYGVHSPFGYEVMTRAVRPGDYAWYGYADIDNLLSGEPFRKIRREARMLLRFASLLNPVRIFLPNGTHPVFQTAVRAVNSRIEVVKTLKQASGCDLICSYGDFVPLDVLLQSLTVPGHWVTVKNVPPGWTRAIYDALPEGMLIVGKHNLFAIHRPGMCKQIYPANVG